MANFTVATFRSRRKQKRGTRNVILQKGATRRENGPLKKHSQAWGGRITSNDHKGCKWSGFEEDVELRHLGGPSDQERNSEGKL